MTLPHLNTLEKLRGTNSGDHVRFYFTLEEIPEMTKVSCTCRNHYETKFRDALQCNE